MANLYSGIVKSNGKYIDLSVISGVAFEVGKDYQLQFFNKGFVREGEIGEGFRIFDATPFTIKFTGAPIYVCSETKLQLNLAE